MGINNNFEETFMENASKAYMNACVAVYLVDIEKIVITR